VRPTIDTVLRFASRAQGARSETAAVAVSAVDGPPVLVPRPRVPATYESTADTAANPRKHAVRGRSETTSGEDVGPLVTVRMPRMRHLKWS
jgi:hypothetical protein